MKSAAPIEARAASRGDLLQGVENADEEALKHGYQAFHDEARHLQADYTPDTVHTDGWEATITTGSKT